MPFVDDNVLTRRLGVLVEAIHAIVYFAPEPQAAYVGLGLKGYSRGYFASRAAPLGAAGPELVTALFGGFAPAMVARALPAVWTTASPQQVQAARRAGAVAALRRLLDEHEGAVVAAADLTGRCVQALLFPGRPMAAAQSGLQRPSEPMEALWHDCTVLREYRGDGHLAAVALLGLVWPEPHVLPGRQVDAQQQQHRGWDDDSWRRAADRMRGRDTAEALEGITDQLAAPAYEVLGAADRVELAQLLEPLATAVSAELPYPNAMGLLPLAASPPAP